MAHQTGRLACIVMPSRINAHQMFSKHTVNYSLNWCTRHFSYTKPRSGIGSVCSAMWLLSPALISSRVQYGRCSVLDAADSCSCREKSLPSPAAAVLSRESGAAPSASGTSGLVIELDGNWRRRTHDQHQLKSTRQSLTAWRLLSHFVRVTAIKLAAGNAHRLRFCYVSEWPSPAVRPSRLLFFHFICRRYLVIIRSETPAAATERHLGQTRRWWLYALSNESNSFFTTCSEGKPINVQTHVNSSVLMVSYLNKFT